MKGVEEKTTSSEDVSDLLFFDSMKRQCLGFEENNP
jgi:hypothetical protein